MIISIDYHKGKSIYRCDKCNKELFKEEVYLISIKELKTNKQIEKYHLCERDFRSLKKGIKNGR